MVTSTEEVEVHSVFSKPILEEMVERVFTGTSKKIKMVEGRGEHQSRRCSVSM